MCMYLLYVCVLIVISLLCKSTPKEFPSLYYTCYRLIMWVYNIFTWDSRLSEVGTRGWTECGCVGCASSFRPWCCFTFGAARGRLPPLSRRLGRCCFLHLLTWRLVFVQCLCFVQHAQPLLFFSNPLTSASGYRTPCRTTYRVYVRAVCMCANRNKFAL